MALAVIVLGATSFLPILGLRFEWVPVHWMAGVVLTLAILFHLYRVFFVHGLGNMMPGGDDIRELVRDMRGKGHEGLSEAKFDALQKGYHAAASITVLAAVVTGLLMLAKIDTSFWRRDPAIFSDQTWGCHLRRPRRLRDDPDISFHSPCLFCTASRTPRAPALHVPRAGSDIRPKGSTMTELLEQAGRMRDAFDRIEESYEFMLAYAAQGRKREVGESGGESQIRSYLTRFDGALADLEVALSGGFVDRQGSDFAGRFRRDIAVIRSVIGLLLSRSSISSDMIDNTNGLIALRALLTDIFFVDQVVLPERNGSTP